MSFADPMLLHDRPFALPPDSAEFTLDIPAPPSVNRTRKVHWRGHKQFEAWKKHAGLHLVANGQYRTARKSRVDRYELTVTLNEALCGLDPDNTLKAISDLLRSLELIKDDSPKFARRIIVEYGDAPDGARVTIRSMHG